ncbi:MAG: PilN domain-containing protein [Candidatus Spyradosoma sp.]
MKTASSQQPPPEKNAATPTTIFLLPSWLFFVENVPADPAATPEELREQVALRLEAAAPVPPEQLLSGFRFAPRANALLCYAASRERCRAFLAEMPAGALHALPLFALRGNDGGATWPRREWFATETELTVLRLDPDNAFPTRVRSVPLERGGRDDAAFRAAIFAARDELRREIGDDGAEESPDVFTPAEQIFDAKKGAGEIRLLRLREDGSVAPAARTLAFSTADESLWLADVRDAETLARERRERRAAALCRRATRALAVFAAVLCAAQLAFLGFRAHVEANVEAEAAQRPQVREIRERATLIEKISKIQANKLQAMRAVAALNAQRPEGVGLVSFSGNGTTGTLAANGTAESIALANEFEKNLRACGLFRDVVFSANMAANGANFSLQCAPVKAELEKLDFYADAEKPAPAAEADEAPPPEAAEAREDEPENGENAS